MAEPEAGPEDSLPIARALGQDFNGLHAAVKGIRNPLGDRRRLQSRYPLAVRREFPQLASPSSDRQWFHPRSRHLSQIRLAEQGRRRHLLRQLTLVECCPI